MIKLFMNKTSKKNRAEVIEHALLYAIKENSLDILEYLLKEREEFWCGFCFVALEGNLGLALFSA